ASTTTVSAASGQYSTDELTITFVEAPSELSRKAYVDANGDPVYLISTADMTVGSDDAALFNSVWGMTRADNSDNQTVFQADIDDSGTVDSADWALFLTSWGKTATGPATKPIVLLPGINEDAEFSLSLGSERVVAGELVAVDVSLANVAALVAYGFTLNYETDKVEFVSVAPADEDLLKSTGGETPLFHHIVADGQVEVFNGMVNGSAISGGGDIVRFVFRVLREFEDNARFEIAEGLVFDPSQLTNPAVVAGVLELQSTPREFALHQNFPNPFNPDTTIKYDLAESADVTLQIYNVLGQVVRTLVASEAQNAGRYQIRWNGMDDRGVPVSSGIYFYQISADGKFSDVRKLMLLK
ncbi:MAG: T9SS type A sorting domain-containing protein, partial [Gemmatimonadota bacterium]|nr:T9SS type A sorting domain-containing protein [Gemmatimonadota bacterium]